MATAFNFPDVGEGIHEGEVVEWLVKEGDLVEEDENIVKIETDKAVVELPAPASGSILKIHFKEGEVVKVGEVLVDIGEKGEKPSATLKKEAPKASKKTSSVVGELEEAPEEPKKKSDKLHVTVKDGKVVPLMSKTKAVPKKAGTNSVQAMPAIRKLAEEMGIDLSTVQASADGIIRAKDLKAHSEGASPAPAPTPPAVSAEKNYTMWGKVDRIPLKGLRKRIAQNMAEQAKIPMVAHMDEVDITWLWKFKDQEKKKIKDTKLTLIPFIVKACVAGLKDQPYVNSSMEENEIILKKFYNLGIAVATDDGLMVPVIKKADRKSIHEIARELEGLAEQARKRSIDIKDMQGGSFTITNVGSLGGIFANPILNMGEAAILALGRAQDKPVVIKGKIVIRKILPLSLTFDHRIMDGAHAALFVNVIKELLENPDKLMIEA